MAGLSRNFRLERHLLRARIVLKNLMFPPALEPELCQQADYAQELLQSTHKCHHPSQPRTGQRLQDLLDDMDETALSLKRPPRQVPLLQIRPVCIPPASIKSTPQHWKLRVLVSRPSHRSRRIHQQVREDLRLLELHPDHPRQAEVRLPDLTQAIQTVAEGATIVTRSLLLTTLLHRQELQFEEGEAI